MPEETIEELQAKRDALEIEVELAGQRLAERKKELPLISDFSSGILKMANAEKQADCDDALLDIAEPLLKLWGSPMKQSDMTLIIELALKCAEDGIRTGRFLEALDEGVRTGELIATADGMISLPPIAP